jgi:hypothetical protein
MLKRALLIGVDDYDTVGKLQGCVNDVEALKPLLSTNHDGSPNFECETRTTASGRVGRVDVLRDVKKLLSPGADMALLYFAGHGDQANNDVVLLTQDASQDDLGVAFSSVLALIAQSPIPEIVIVLDCCFAGGAGGVPEFGGDKALLRPGLTILSACRTDQTAAEIATLKRGMFSYYLCAALEGGAADVLGKITAAGLFAYLTESFGAWGQRPTLKLNLDRLQEFRICEPAVPLAGLRRLPALFPTSDYEFPLDPSYEPDLRPPHPVNEEIFGLLQKFRTAKLLKPIGAEHLYFAAKESKSCCLTPLGRHYWNLASKKRI